MGDFKVNESAMIQVSDITQYFYCPRKVYFLKTLGIRQTEKIKMTMGKEEHAKEYRRVLERKDIFGIPTENIERIIYKLPIESTKLKLYGIIDMIIKFYSGEFLPVEVKYSIYHDIRQNRLKQLIAYALLIDEKFKTNVKKGIIYFSTDRITQVVDISSEDKEFLIRDIKYILNLIKSEKMPEVIQDKKCNYCEMKKFCI